MIPGRKIWELKAVVGRRLLNFKSCAYIIILKCVIKSNKIRKKRGKLS